MKDNVMLSSSHKAKRDLLTKMSSIRNTDGGSVVRRNYTYDRLGRPVTRQTLRSGGAMNETFDYDDRSESTRRLAGRLDTSAAFAPKGENCRRLEGRLAKSDRFCPNGVRSREATPQASIDGAMPSQLTGATLGEAPYAYAYDNIGNRITAQEDAESVTYEANNLNQYTQIDADGTAFVPEYDADGNQTLIQTSTGIWKVQYNGQNRAIRFESEDGHTVITCGYDYMGHRFEKKVTSDGAVTLHERYIYRGYLQIAAYDLREGHAEHPDLRFIVWDPTQGVATRPLAIRENGVWYTYGWDLTKNICELYGQEGFIRTIYTYSPYGQVIAEGDITQPIQWSSEMYDAELGLVYYNFRYYNPRDGRWTRRDDIQGHNLYAYVSNESLAMNDYVGLQERPVLNAEVISQDFQFCRAFDIRMVWRLLAYPGKGVISQYVKWTADIKQRRNDGTYVDVTGQAMGELTPYTEYWVRNDDDFMDDFSYSNESLINKTVGTIEIEAEAVYAENASKPWFSWPEEQMPSGELSMRRGKKLILSSENSNYVIKKLVVKWDCSCTPKKSEGSLSISNS